MKNKLTATIATLAIMLAHASAHAGTYDEAVAEANTRYQQAVDAAQKTNGTTGESLQNAMKMREAMKEAKRKYDEDMTYAESIRISEGRRANTKAPQPQPVAARPQTPVAAPTVPTPPKPSGSEQGRKIVPPSAEDMKQAAPPIPGARPPVGLNGVLDQRLQAVAPQLAQQQQVDQNINAIQAQQNAQREQRQIELQRMKDMPASQFQPRF